MIGGNTMRCPACGSDNTKGTVYCDACGVKLSSEDTPSPSATTTDAVATQPAANASLMLTEAGNEYSISKDVVLVGRESVPDNVFPDIDLTPDDPDGYVSRRHAQIQRQDEDHAIIDLDSKNGTFVNDKRLSGGTPLPLASGDEIRLGKLRIKFLLAGQDEYSKGIENPA